MRRRAFSGAGWVLTAALALILAGCGGPAAESPVPSAPTPPPTETAAPTQTPPPGPLVYTDYSKLEEKDNTPRPNIYERWYGEFTDHLIPSDDYGPLIPFSGGAIADPWDGEYGIYALEGLMTLDGKVVVDPVYKSVVRLGWGGDWDMGTVDGYHSALLLTTRYAGDGENLFGGHSDMRSVLCAADGSWVTEREYRFDYETLCYGRIGENGALFALREDNTLVMLDIATGEETFAVTLDGFTESELNDLLYYTAYGDGRITACIPNYSSGYLTSYRCYCWDEDGNEISLPADADNLGGFSEGLCGARQASSGKWGYLDVNGQWAIQPQFSDAHPFRDGVALLGSHARTLIDREGNILYETPTYDNCQQTGDYWYFTGYSGDAGLVLDKEGNEVASPLLFGGAVYAQNYGWALMRNADGSHVLARGTESWAIPKEWGYVRATTEDTVFFDSWEEYSPQDNRPRWAVWRPGVQEKPTVFMGSFEGVRADPVTGKRYCLIYNSDGTYTLANAGDGKALFSGLKGWPQLYGGRCLTIEDSSGSRTVELLDENGSVLFSRQWESPFD